MPAPVSLSPNAHVITKLPGGKSRAHTRSKRTRFGRRRGKAQDTFGSDDEIEREVGSDSDSGDQSTLDSASDSDTEPISAEDVVSNGHSQILTPNTTQSSGEIRLSEHHTPSKLQAVVNADHTSFFSATGNWSEMVADENDNGPADLPVIDFQDFDTHHPLNHALPITRSRKATKKKPNATHPSSAVVPNINDIPQTTNEHSDEPVASTSHQSPQPVPNRLPGQSARKAYQQRLDADPSYVPKVGEFWGHDDRLLEKDLRSLSGWWRGRWQGRGRSRGSFDRGFSGRGRGGFTGTSHRQFLPEQTDQEASQCGEQNVHSSDQSQDVPPVERQWTHDGFEEMKRKDERRQSLQQDQQHSPHSTRGGVNNFRGSRGGFTASRGRGGFSRGGFVHPPNGARTNISFVPHAGRPWFAMKPERMWTKQFEGFLYFDPTLKPRPGQGVGYRVRLPGNAGRVIRGSSRSHQPTNQLSAEHNPSTASVVGSEDGEKIFTVRMPKQLGKERVNCPTLPPPVESPAQETSTAVVEPSIDDAFTVRPELQARSEPLETRSLDPFSMKDISEPSLSSLPTPTHSHSSKDPSSASRDVISSLQALPQQILHQHQENPSIEQRDADERRRILAEEAVLRHPSDSRLDNPEKFSRADSRPAPPVLPPLQTSFSPIPQSTPPYDSPYGYPSALPPGIAVSQNGMAYEVATGRAVYLQPSVPMYNPRPVMHSHVAPHGVAFVPTHVHHHSTASPDFLPASHTPPVNGFVDPTTGAPIFVLPRQSSRIEIRAPSDPPSGQTQAKAERRSSSLRTNAATFEPAQSDSNQDYHTSVSQATTGASSYAQSSEMTNHNSVQPPIDPSIIAYSPYQHHYYYPETYGYPGYMDMSRVAQYEMYAPDPSHNSQTPIYY